MNIYKISQFNMQPTNELQEVSDHDLQQLFLKKKSSNQFDSCTKIIIELERRKTQLSQELQTKIDYVKFINEKVRIAEAYFKEDVSKYRVDEMKANKANVKIFSKHIKSQIHIAAEGQAEIQITPVTSMIFQSDLYSQWMPLCKLGSDALTVGLAEKVAYAEYSLPLLPRKGGFIFGCLIDRLKLNNTLLVYFEGTTNRKDYEQLFKQEFKPKISPSLFQLRFGVLEAKLIGQNKFKFRVYSLTDVKFTIYYIPGGLLGFFVKKIGGHLFKIVVEKIGQMKDSEWEKRIKEDKTGLYKYIEEKYKTMKQLIQN